VELVFEDVGIQEVEFDSPDLGLPYLAAHTAVREGNLNHHGLVIGPTQELEGHPKEVVLGIPFLLPAIGVEELAEVASTV
jgi:hypothetical protein